MILPAILETDPKKQLQRVKELSPFAKTLHIDVADGRFVKTNNVKAFRMFSRVVGAESCISLLELHLMVEKPLAMFSLIRKVKNVKRIVLQFESDWRLAFDTFKRYYTVGIALTLETSIAELLNDRTIKPSFIQLLSVTPGAQGNPFRSEIYQRVKMVKRLFPTLRIEIDGAMNPARIKKLKMMGAMDFVVGSYLKKGNLKKRIATLSRFDFLDW